MRWLIALLTLILLLGGCSNSSDPGAPPPRLTIIPPQLSPTPLPVTPLAPRNSPVAAPAPTSISRPRALVANGGNLRSEPRLADETILAQVCPADELAILAEEQAADIRWVQVEVLQITGDCSDTRAQPAMIGWLSSVLVGPVTPVAVGDTTASGDPAPAAPTLPVAADQSEPTARPAPTAEPPTLSPPTPTPSVRPFAESGQLVPLNGWLVSEESPPVALSGDGRLIARGSPPDGDGTLQLWDTNTGTLRQTLAWDAPQYSITLNNDGTRLAASLGNSSVAVWDTDTWRLAAMLIPPQAEQGAQNPTGLAFTADTQFFAHEVANGVAVWALESSVLLGVLPTTLRQTTLTFAPDGSLLVITNDTSDFAEVWDMATATLRYTLDLPVRRVAFAPDGTQLAVAADGALALHQAQDGALLSVLDPTNSRTTAIAYARDGRLLAVAPAFQMQVWRIPEATLATSQETSLNSLAFTADGRELVGVLGAAGVVQRWEVGGATAAIPAAPPQLAQVRAPSSLYREPRATGADLPQLCSGDQVELLQRRGDWWQVRVATLTEAACATPRPELRATGWLSRRVVEE
ncbi:MAG: hypothetical protein HC911_13405 [Chloroflexaceae bacterium]|nr:hypothetical protein [Chloroflexaceae bacterium]